MADKQTPTQVRPLPTWARWGAASLGSVLLGVVVLAVVWDRPAVREWAADGSLVKLSREVCDLSGVLTALVVAGAALLAYALNGIQIVRFGAGPFNFDGRPDVETTEQDNLADVPGVDATKAEREDVPIHVIADAITAWPPDAGDPPTDLSQFESAWKHEGQGSHPWFLKFKNRPVVRVYYGGRSRTGPHVSSPGRD